MQKLLGEENFVDIKKQVKKDDWNKIEKKDCLEKKSINDRRNDVNKTIK